tara:strand:- start:174 stop:629 length:456 start_codon:yes stop_codon:yes gene_type:complete
MSTVKKVIDTLDKIKAMVSESGEFEGRDRIKSAKQLSEFLQRRYDNLPEDDKKTLKKRVNSSLANLKNILKKPDKPNLKNRAKGGSISKLKAGGFPDLSGDGKVTQKDVLMGRGVVKKAMGGEVNGLKKMGMKVGGLAGRLAQRGYGKARR